MLLRQPTHEIICSGFYRIDDVRQKAQSLYGMCCFNFFSSTWNVDFGWLYNFHGKWITNENNCFVKADVSFFPLQQQQLSSAHHLLNTKTIIVIKIQNVEIIGVTVVRKVR